ncbi:MAG TPA: hypothetical protein VL443_06300 [Cyclobacteriaceae bacterium]|jgi:transposase|nr:hypothetical protein [Cyclobacteriaceae bacterium]
MIDLKKMRDEQKVLREQVIERYKQKGLSINALAKEIGVSYFCLRRFIMGQDMAYKNLFKVQNWLN